MKMKLLSALLSIALTALAGGVYAQTAQSAAPTGETTVVDDGGNLKLAPVTKSPQGMMPPGMPPGMQPPSGGAYPMAQPTDSTSIPVPTQQGQQLLPQAGPQVSPEMSGQQTSPEMSGQQPSPEMSGPPQVTQSTQSQAPVPKIYPGTQIPKPGEMPQGMEGRLAPGAQ